MADSNPWTTKRKMKARGAKLAQARRVAKGVSTAETNEGAGPSSIVELDPPVVPEPVASPPEVSVERRVEDPGVGSETEYDSDAEDDFDDDKAQEIFDDFILALPLDDRRLLAVVLMESFRKRQKMQVVDAAREAASIVGYSDRTVRKLRKQFFDNKGELDGRKQGKYERITVYRDEEVSY